MSPLASESLDLDPANPSSLDIITATRAGTATYTDASGNIQTASPNTVRVDHVQGAELTPTKYQHVANTDFSDWIQASSTTLTDGSGYAGQPSKIFTTSATHRTFHTPAFATTAGTTYTGSFWIRRVSGTGTIRLYHQYSAQGNLTNITSDISEEWTRVERTFTGHASSGDIWFGVWIDEQGDSVEIAMPQVEEGTTASSFVANTTGSPKFTGISATFAPRVPMIVVEPSSENLVRISEDFSNNIWVKNDTSVVSGQLSPSGSETAHLIKGSTNSSRHNVVHGALTNTVTGSFSLFAKAKELRYLQIASANTTQQVANVDLLSGTIGTVGSSFSDVTLEAFPDNWYRITLVSPNQYNSYYISLVSGLTAGWLESWAMPNDTDGLYIWGAQLEESSVPTSYIPTSGSTVTRAADDLVIDGSDFTDFYNDAEGTVYVESTGRGYFDYNTSFAFSDNSSSNRIYARSTSNSGGLTVFSGGSVSASMGGLTVVANNVLSRSAHSFKANNFLTSRDGNSATPDTSGNMPVGMDRLYIGAGQTGGNQLNGHIKRLIYWPYHSDNL